jgi:hypothetical protein
MQVHSRRIPVQRADGRSYLWSEIVIIAAGPNGENLTIGTVTNRQILTTIQ